MSLAMTIRALIGYLGAFIQPSTFQDSDDSDYEEAAVYPPQAHEICDQAASQAYVNFGQDPSQAYWFCDQGASQAYWFCDLATWWHPCPTFFPGDLSPNYGLFGAAPYPSVWSDFYSRPALSVYYPATLTNGKHDAANFLVQLDHTGVWYQVRQSDNSVVINGVVCQVELNYATIEVYGCTAIPIIGSAPILHAAYYGILVIGSNCTNYQYYPANFVKSTPHIECGGWIFQDETGNWFGTFDFINLFKVNPAEAEVIVTAFESELPGIIEFLETVDLVAFQEVYNAVGEDIRLRGFAFPGLQLSDYNDTQNDSLMSLQPEPSSTEISSQTPESTLADHQATASVIPMPIPQDDISQPPTAPTSAETNVDICEEGGGDVDSGDGEAAGGVGEAAGGGFGDESASLCPETKENVLILSSRLRHAYALCPLQTPCGYRSELDALKARFVRAKDTAKDDSLLADIEAVIARRKAASATKSKGSAYVTHIPRS